MSKSEKRPMIPPEHRVYPRGSTPAPAPKPSPEGRRPSAWTRAVPPDRQFPR